jgi:hypothetical protein
LKTVSSIWLLVPSRTLDVPPSNLSMLNMQKKTETHFRLCSEDTCIYGSTAWTARELRAEWWHAPVLNNNNKKYKPDYPQKGGEPPETPEREGDEL